MSSNEVSNKVVLSLHQQRDKIVEELIRRNLRSSLLMLASSLLLMMLQNSHILIKELTMGSQRGATSSEKSLVLDKCQQWCFYWILNGFRMTNHLMRANSGFSSNMVWEVFIFHLFLTMKLSLWCNCHWDKQHTRIHHVSVKNKEMMMTSL